jgi:pyridoxal-phosphate dependent enzyme
MVQVINKTIKAVSRIVAGGMLRENTPIEHYPELGLWVKREDKACIKPGPQFSKTRGVYSRVKSVPQNIIGVLDTAHSQAGHAVAMACKILGKECINFYPNFKHTPGPKEPQRRAEELGAELRDLPAGRSAILFHAAKKQTEALGGFMMPNALKLEESVLETAREVPSESYDYVLIPISSGTIAAGVIKGFHQRQLVKQPKFLIHMGYTRSKDQVLKYLSEQSGVSSLNCILIDEEYQYKDVARGDFIPPWPCNQWYDLKAVQWWLANRSKYQGKCLLWNIG